MEVVPPEVVCPTCVQPAGAVAVAVALATVLTRTSPLSVETPEGTVTDRLVAFPCTALEPTKATAGPVDPAWIVWVIVSDKPPASVTFNDTV